MENIDYINENNGKEITRATVTKLPPEVEEELEYIDFLTMLQEFENK